MKCSARFVAAILSVALMAIPALGQLDVGDFQLVPELSGLNNGAMEPELKVTGRVRMAPGSTVGLLEVTASMAPRWHVYSLTQPSGGPMRSEIKLAPSSQYRLLGSFAPNRPPYVHYVDVFQMDAEEFASEVTWSVPIERTGDGGELAIQGYVEGQVCSDSGGCIPFGEQDASFTAKVSSSVTAEETKSLTGFQLTGTHALIRSWLSSAKVKPGEAVQLHVAFNPDADWHVYAFAELPASMFQKPTLVQATLPGGWTVGAARSSSAIISEEGLPNDPPIRYYDGPATISVPIQIPESAQPGSYALTGHVAYQTCAKQCDPPTAATWAAELEVVADVDGDLGIGVVEVGTKPVSYDSVVALLQAGAAGATATRSLTSTPPSDAADAPATAGRVRVADLDFSTEQQQSNVSFLAVLGAAFLGGFVLNFMPCVLPVIGLKILAFVEQAGSDRLKIFRLNVWYALGMLAIFWILALLAAAPALGLSENGLGWGEQFNYQGFAIPLICVVFVMALSFLGVWEIPIPGFATTSKASELAEQEGNSGAFFKGSVTTILATPCSAPGLAAAYAFAVNSRSATMPFVIFTVMGLGMAFPYLVIGAFPSLIRFLPRPGAWMDTFKQLMGFVLLGTVVFLMQNVTFTNMLPTVGLLFGLWFACWWIGRVPLTADAGKRTRAWAVATIIGLLATVISFGRHVDALGMTFSGLVGHSERKYTFQVDRDVSRRSELAATSATRQVAIAHSENALPWEPFSTLLLDELISTDHTVLVDFTADW